MSIEVKLKGIVFEVKTFPKLMIDKNRTIVLFSQEDRGIVVSAKESIYDVGDFNNDWAMSCFSDYEGELTLKNK